MQESTEKCFNQDGGSASPGDTTLIKIGLGCDEPRYWYQMLSDGSIKHVTSGKCFHPRGGSSLPTDNTDLVLHSGMYARLFILCLMHDWLLAVYLHETTSIQLTLSLCEHYNTRPIYCGRNSCDQNANELRKKFFVSNSLFIGWKSCRPSLL